MTEERVYVHVCIQNVIFSGNNGLVFSVMTMHIHCFFFLFFFKYSTRKLIKSINQSGFEGFVNLQFKQENPKKKKN